jgi:hypothetical protein
MTTSHGPVIWAPDSGGRPEARCSAGGIACQYLLHDGTGRYCRADSRLQRLPDTRAIPDWCIFSAQAEDDIHEITGGEA